MMLTCTSTIAIIARILNGERAIVDWISRQPDDSLRLAA